MGKTLLWIGLVALLVIAGTATGNAASAPANFDITGLQSAFSISEDQQNRINSLYQALINNGVTDLQSRLMLSQLLFESGLLTDVANYKRMNLNNYAGLKGMDGNYLSFNNLDDFMSTYIQFLSKRNDPFDATSLSDFVNKLYANCYTGCPPETPWSQYYNGLLTYFNLL